MRLFQSEEERQRRQLLKEMEDKRLRLVGELARAGIRPEKMLLVANGRGGLSGLSRVGGGFLVIIGPDFGDDAPFVWEKTDRLPVRTEPFREPSVGLGGAFGFGKKGAVGFHLILDRSEGEVVLPVLANRGSAMICTAQRNPLLSQRRRKGDANVVWDLRPLEKRDLSAMEKFVREELNIQ